MSVPGHHDPRSFPILPVPGLELPWRECLHPPLRHPVRAVSEPRFLFGLGRHDLPHDAPPRLPRRLADQIDEYRLVGHGPLPCEVHFRKGPVCSRFFNGTLRKPFKVEGLSQRGTARAYSELQFARVGLASEAGRGKHNLTGYQRYESIDTVVTDITFGTNVSNVSRNALAVQGARPGRRLRLAFAVVTHGSAPMTEKWLSAQQLARKAKVPLSTVSYWARESLLTYQRKNGRTRLFPEAEAIARIRYIRDRQSRPEGVRLDEIRRELGQGRHHSARRGSG